MSRAAGRSTRAAGSMTRQRILTAAAELFAEHGFAGTSIRTIARRLDLSDPAIHYHFRTKQDIFQELLKEPEYGHLPLDEGTLNLPTVVDQVMHLFSWWTERLNFGQMLLREQLASEPASLAFLASNDYRWDEGVTVHLERLLGAGGEDVSQLVFLLLCGVYWDAILAYRDEAPEVVAQPFFTRRVRAMVKLALGIEREAPE